MTVNVKSNSSNKTLVEKNQKVSISMEKLWSGTARNWEVNITLSKAPNNYIIVHSSIKYKRRYLYYE